MIGQALDMISSLEYLEDREKPNKATKIPIFVAMKCKISYKSGIAYYLGVYQIGDDHARS